MMRHEPNLSLGDLIRDARIAKKIGLRGLAITLEITPSYQSDIEYNRRIPSEDLLSKISRALDLNFDDLMARAGRLGDEATRYMMQTPSVGMLFRKLSNQRVTSDVIDRLTQMADELIRKPEEKG
jgi:transcriptional regulator with XRE-family HTH domain